MEEIWNDIPDFEGYYQGSNFGKIKSLYHGKERILRPSTSNKGYYQVVLFKNGKSITYKVHRLVWMAFNGPIPEGLEINHINEIKTDNRLENLELLTHKENTNYGTRTERAAKSMINGKCSKPVLQFDLEGNLLNEFPSLCEVERQLGLFQSNISHCCLGRYKTCGGYVWKYK